MSTTMPNPERRFSSRFGMRFFLAFRISRSLFKNGAVWRSGCWLAFIAAAGLAGAATVPPLGGGNVTQVREFGRLALLRELGAGMVRIPLGQSAYWKNGSAAPEQADDVLRAAQQQGLRVILLFEYYTRGNDELGGFDEWKAIGQSFATRFAPNSAWWLEQGVRDYGVEFYSAINEPMWKANNPTPIEPEAYARALEGLADGVHAVGSQLKVSPGGYQEVPLFSHNNPYLQAVAPLYNQGKLHAIDIHRYWDVDYVPMDKSYRWSLQAQFDDVKKWAGITREVAFQTTEMNFKKRKVSEDEAAQGFLTALWDALTVTDSQGRPVTAFVMPWNIFHNAQRDENYGLCTQEMPWTPNARGRVLQRVLEWTRGMEIVSTDPKGTGLTILRGPKKEIRIWQNRKDWSRLYGSTITLGSLPPFATRLEVHGWDGLRRTLALTQDEKTLVLPELPVNETLVFVLR